MTWSLSLRKTCCHLVQVKHFRICGSLQVLSHGELGQHNRGLNCTKLLSLEEFVPREPSDALAFAEQHSIPTVISTSFFLLTCTNFICFVAHLKSCFQNVVCLFNAFSSACLYVLIFFVSLFFFWFSFGICFIFHHPPGSPNIDPVTVTFQPTSLQWFPPFCDLFWGLVLLHIVV